MTPNQQHDWQPLDCTPPDPRFTRCTRCGTTRGANREGIYWYRIPGVNCGPAHRWHGISEEPACVSTMQGEHKEGGNE